MKKILFVALALASLASEKGFADEDQKYLGLSSEERAYLNPKSKTFKSHTNEMLLERERNYCIEKGEVLDESNLDSIIYSEYAGDDPLVDLSAEKKAARSYPLWPRWFYTDGKKASYVKFNENIVKPLLLVPYTVLSSCAGAAVTAVACVATASTPVGLAVFAAAVVAVGAPIQTCGRLTETLRVKTGQTEVRKLTYAKALKKLRKVPPGTTPSIVKMRIEYTEKVPHLLFVPASVPCMNLAGDEAIKPKMTEVKWKWKSPTRPASVQENLPRYERVENENASLHSEAFQTTEGASSQQVSEDYIAENIVNQDERMGQLIQQLVDLPAPPMGFADENINEDESEEDIPALVLE